MAQQAKGPLVRFKVHQEPFLSLGIPDQHPDIVRVLGGGCSQQIVGFKLLRSFDIVLRIGSDEHRVGQLDL